MGSGPEKKTRRTAKALVKLLRRVPAERLEVMLEPDVLLLLWVESGRGKDSHCCPRSFCCKAIWASFSAKLDTPCFFTCFLIFN